MLNMNLKGYHNTKASNVECILKNGFTYKHNDEHWLGQGIYFFADDETAIDNLDMLMHDEEMKTIAVEIEVDESLYLDLDVKENLNSFRKYFSEKRRLLEKSGNALLVKETDKRKAMLKYRCFFMDLFKRERGYTVISKTFAKDSPPYAEPIENIVYFGLPFLEKYICVSSNEYIVKKNLVEREEWIV